MPGTAWSKETTRQAASEGPRAGTPQAGTDSEKWEPERTGTPGPAAPLAGLRVSLRDTLLTAVGGGAEATLMCAETPDPKGVGLGTEILT